MAGYYGYSMSNNAVKAYNSGKRPWSRWTKTLILEDVKALTIDSYEECEGNNEELDSLKKKFKLLSKCSTDTLRKHLLKYAGWHHTSSRYNKTEFYEVDEDMFLTVGEKDIQDWIESAKADRAAVATPICYRGKIRWLEWGGTRNHPKAKERELSNVFIQEKGAFYYVYDPNQSNKLILKKKIGSNGTFVTYNNRK